MKIINAFVLSSLLLLTVAGCSDNNPTGGGGPIGNTNISTWVDIGGYWSSEIDASSFDDFVYFSFTDADTTTPAKRFTGAEGDWDIAMRRELIKLNGGFSAQESGECVGTDLGAVDFDEVTIDDTAGVSWISDHIDYFIDQWYDYNMNTHQLTANQYVFSMVDAGGENYLKFRVDSIVGAGMPPSMGTVYISYFYQTTPSSFDLDGTIQTGSINVGSGTGYFDFSSGTEVTPADPANSLDWDIAFNNYNLMMNSGPSGSGACAAFYAYGELTDPTEIESFTIQPDDAPLFPDAPGSALTDWYNYNGQTHTLSSKSHVYLIKNSNHVYKMRIDSYYKNVGGVSTSGHYNFIWKEISDPPTE